MSITVVSIPLKGSNANTILPENLIIKNSNGRFQLSGTITDSLNSGNIHSASFKITDSLEGDYGIVYNYSVSITDETESEIAQAIVDQLNNDCFTIDEIDPTVINFVNDGTFVQTFSLVFPNVDNRFLIETGDVGDIWQLDSSYNYIQNSDISAANSAISLMCVEYFNNTYFTELSNDIPNRYTKNRELNLVNYLPENFREEEVAAFLKFFEDFLNQMFDGFDGYSLNTSGISANCNAVGFDSLSGFTDGLNIATNQIERYIIESSATVNKFSILEKIYRLSETHDPDLIDIDFIQYFAKNLGYSLNVYRTDVGSELGNLATTQSVLNKGELNKYLRFMVSNLPTWYKIKTTDNAVKVMLYSFGLVGELIKAYSDMKNDSNGNPNWSWLLDYSKDLNRITNDYYITPHFALKIDIDSSVDIIEDIERRSAVIRAIDSIRPINCVFKNLSGYIERLFNLYVRPYVRFSRYIRIGNIVEKFQNGDFGEIIQKDEEDSIYNILDLENSIIYLSANDNYNYLTGVISTQTVATSAYDFPQEFVSAEGFVIKGTDGNLYWPYQSIDNIHTWQKFNKQSTILSSQQRYNINVTSATSFGTLQFERFAIDFLDGYPTSANVINNSYNGTYITNADGAHYVYYFKDGGNYITVNIAANVGEFVWVFEKKAYYIKDAVSGWIPYIIGAEVSQNI